MDDKNKVEFTLTDFLKGMESRLTNELRTVKLDNNKRHDQHAQETKENIQQLRSDFDKNLARWFGAIIFIGLLLGGICTFVYWKNQDLQNDLINMLIEREIESSAS